MAVIIAVGVNSDGVREVLGMAVGASEAEPFWTSFLRSLTRRGLRGVKLVIADSLWSTEHESYRTRTHDSYTTPWDTIRTVPVVNELRAALRPKHPCHREPHASAPSRNIIASAGGHRAH